MEKNKIISIEVIGSGCANCKKLHELAILAVKDLNIDVEVGYSNDIQKALAMGVLQFPVLAVNDKAVITGMASAEKVKEALKAVSDKKNQNGGCSCAGCCDCQ